jgi:hypothetical protein
VSPCPSMSGTSWIATARGTVRMVRTFHATLWKDSKSDGHKR